MGASVWVNKAYKQTSKCVKSTYLIILEINNTFLFLCSGLRKIAAESYGHGWISCVHRQNSAQLSICACSTQINQLILPGFWSGYICVQIVLIENTNCFPQNLKCLYQKVFMMIVLQNWLMNIYQKQCFLPLQGIGVSLYILGVLKTSQSKLSSSAPDLE